MPFETPILFIIFNRPDCTLRALNEIKKVQPKKLYISADGPRQRKSGEKEICELTRKIVFENITWACEVKSLIRDENVGCKLAVSSAINWFFENEEQGIILEDDCLPEHSFFNFCQILLKKFKDENSVMHIGGTNFLTDKIRIDASYYFSKMIHIWGWATWRRAWKLYDIEMNHLDELEKDFKKITVSKKEKNYWIKIFRKVKKNQIDTWDYQWQYSIWVNNGIGITPAVNMISNIGFGPGATHTVNAGETVANMSTEAINTIHHPLTIERNSEADNFEMTAIVSKAGFFEAQFRDALIKTKKFFIK